MDQSTNVCLKYKKSSNGFSLVEFMVTIALLGIFSLIIGSYIQHTIKMRQQTEEAGSFLNELNIVSAGIEQVMSQAVDVQLVNRALGSPNLNNHDVTGAWSAPANGGAIINVDINNDGNFDNDLDPVTGTDVLFDSDALNNDPTIVSSIAVFLREGGDLDAQDRSIFVPTAVYYQQQGPTTAGVLYISSGASTVGAQTLGPSRNGTYYSRISRLRMLNARTIGGLRSIDMELTFRKFTDPNPTTWRWCPEPDITANLPACQLAAGFQESAFVDQKQSFKITFRNNLVLDPKTRTTTRPLGQIYFFNYPNPKQ